jgi:hypothetical protein
MIDFRFTSIIHLVEPLRAGFTETICFALLFDHLVNML